MSIDLFDITDNSYKTQVFYQSGTWVKPRGITMVSFFVVGAGGGGGKGANLATNVGNYGGGGAGGGAGSRLLIPAIFLPDTLFVVVGVGGQSSTSGGATYVDTINNGNLFTTRIVFSNGGGGGGDSPGNAIGSVGIGGVASSLTTSAIYLNLGIQSSIAGGNGGVPSATTNTNLTSGGGRGGGRNSLGVRTVFPGGIVGNNVLLPSISPSDLNVTLVGPSGVNSLKPFQSYGGCGGWSSTGVASQCGGNGGNGILGAGGGAGGGGNTGCPTGVSLGGNGGNGIVIITCF